MPNQGPSSLLSLARGLSLSLAFLRLYLYPSVSVCQSLCLYLCRCRYLCLGLSASLSRSVSLSVSAPPIYGGRCAASVRLTLQVLDLWSRWWKLNLLTSSLANWTPLSELPVALERGGDQMQIPHTCSSASPIGRRGRHTKGVRCQVGGGQSRGTNQGGQEGRLVV